MERSSGSTDNSNEMYGSLLIFRNDGKEGPLYDLSKGTTTIGASIEADIRLKIIDDRLEDVHCSLEVKENGIAVIINKSLAAPVKVNGGPLKKFKILKHEDYFEVLGKKFQYFNDNISQEDYQRNHYESRKSVAPVLQTKTIETKIPVHQQANFLPYKECPYRKSPRKSRGKSGIDGSKTTSKLVVSKALSKLPKPRRRLSLNLVPEVLGEKRKSMPKKSCDCCLDLIDFNSPRKSILIKAPMINSELSPKEDKILNSVKEMDMSSLEDPVGNTDLEDTYNFSENIANEESPETSQRLSRKIDRISSKRTSSVGHMNDSVLNLEDRTPENIRRNSRNETNRRISSVVYTPGRNDSTLHLEPRITETSRRYSGLLQRTPVKDLTEGNDLTPGTGKASPANKSSSIGEPQEKNVSILSLEEKTPKTNPRSSRIIVERSLNKKRTSSVGNQEDVDIIMPLEEDTSRRLSRSINRSSKKISVGNLDDLNVPLNKSIPETSQKNSRSSSRRRATSIKVDTPETSKRFTRNIEQSADKKKTSVINLVQNNSTPEIRQIDSSSNKETPRTNLKSSDQRNRSSIGYVHKEDEMMNLRVKTPETNKKISNSMNRSANRTSLVQNTNDLTSLKGNDSTTETSQRYSENTGISPMREASSIGDVEEKIIETSSLEGKTPRADLTSSRVIERSSKKRRTSLICYIHEEDESMLSKTGTPETSKRFSNSVNKSSRKRTCSLYTESNLNASTSETSRRFSRNMDKGSNLPEENNLKSETSQMTMDRCSIKQRSKSVGHINGKNTIPSTTETPENIKRVSRGMARSSIKRKSSVGNESNLTLPLYESTPANIQRCPKNINTSSTKGRISSVVDTLDGNDSILPLETGTPLTNKRVSRNIKYSSVKRTSIRNIPEEENTTPKTSMNIIGTSEEIMVSPIVEDLSKIPETKRSSRIVEGSLRGNIRSFNYESDASLLDETGSESFATSRNGSSTGDLQKMSYATMHSVQETRNQSSVEDIGDMNQSYSDANRKSVRRSTKNESLIELSGDDIVNNSRHRTYSVRRSSFSVDGNEGNSLIELSENYPENESTQSNTHSASRKSSNKRSSRQKTYPIDECADEVSKSSNRKSFIPNRNSSVIALSEDSVENELDPASERRYSKRTSKTFSSTRQFKDGELEAATGNESLLELSESDLDNESDQYIHSTSIKASGIRSSQKNKTYSLDQSNNDLTDEVFESHVETEKRKSSSRRSLKENSSSTEHSNDLENSWEHKTSRRSSNRIVDLTTPNQSAKKRMSNVEQYQPKTEEITPTTPENNKRADASFKTPLNTPGLFNEIKKSMLQSRSKTQNSSSNLMEEFNKEQGLKRPRESVGNSRRSIKKMKLIINEDDTFEESHTDSAELDSVLEESSESFVQNTTDGAPSSSVSVDETIEDGAENPQEANKMKWTKSPKNDLTNIVGVKKIFATPKYPKSPKNDLTEIVGVKKIFATPKNTRSPKNDLTNVPNLRRIMSPKSQNSPRNDLSDVRGIKRLMKTPKAEKFPLNDLSDVEGVAEMFNVSRVHRLSVANSDIENNEELFDRIFEKRPPRQYRGKSSSPMGKSMDAYGDDRRKTVGDQCSPSPRVQEWVNEQNMNTLEKSEKISDKDETNKSDIPARQSTSDGRSVVAEVKPEVEQAVAVDSPLALTRGRRKINRVVHSPQLKVTRSRRNVKNPPFSNEETSQEVTELDQSDINKDTKRTRETDNVEESVNKQSANTEPRRGGRRAANKKKDSEETKPPVTSEKITIDIKRVKVLEEAEKVPAESPRTRQRIVKAAQKEDIEEKKNAPRRGRKAKATSTESDEKYDEQVVEKVPLRRATRANTAPKENQIENKVAPKRGRNAKVVQIETTEEDIAMTKEETVHNRAASRRGRNAKNVHNEEKEVENEVDDTEMKEKPSKKAATRRGRNAKAVESEEKEVENEVIEDINIKSKDESVVKKATNRRGRHTKVVQSEEKEIENEITVETATSTKEETVRKTVNRRGRYANLAQNEESEEKKHVEAVAPVKRGRRGKTAANVEEEQQNSEIYTKLEKKTDSPSNKRPRRNRKGETKVDEELEPKGSATEKVVQNVLESLTPRQTRTARKRKQVHFE